MNRDQLTTHLGKTLLVFNQVRVPGLEPGTYWTDSTQAVEVSLSRSAVLTLLPSASAGIFIASADTESIKDLTLPEWSSAQLD